MAARPASLEEMAPENRSWYLTWMNESRKAGSGVGATGHLEVKNHERV